MAVPPQRETAAERGPDGDADDAVKQTANAAPAQQVNPQGVGTRVDIFA